MDKNQALAMLRFIADLYNIIQQDAAEPAATEGETEVRPWAPELSDLEVPKSRSQ